MRVEIVETCGHDSISHIVDYPDCPGGSRREASESELLALVADLLTLKGLALDFCKQHLAAASAGDPSVCLLARRASTKHPCRLEKVIVLPVGVLVDETTG